MYFAYSHAPISCYFAHSSRDFVVQEIPLYAFSGSGEHRILRVRKKNLSTFELLSIIAQAFNLPTKSIGYAGLKDKHATTTQYLSLPAKSTQNFCAIFDALAKQHDIKLLDSTLHSNKLRLGHLKGNRFFVRLKKLNPTNAKKLESTLAHIAQNGFPNFFGFQRFGINGDNYLLGLSLSQRKNAQINPYLSLLAQLHPSLANPQNPLFHTKRYSRTMQEFFISSYQSFLFNGWLQARIQLSAWAREFNVKDLQEIARRYATAPNPLESTFAPPLETPLQSAQNACIATLCARFLQSLPKVALESLCAQPQAFTLLDGDLCCHYPYGKLFTLDSATQAECERFSQQGFSPTGALSGQNLKAPSTLAGQLEQSFLAPIPAPSSRRYAWVWASDVEFDYKPEVAQAELHFSLPSGAYATSFLEQVLKRSLAPNPPKQ
ncbi:tRNA pseudouridine(13) synthase TruD [Helicobacter sp. XJK30-2]|uniref:tRNA pseudouridine(13) synthase TruD n=1 Tax=Helicobacter zhangjianzhongii TaxID=2974574 RepID=A0ACC6FQH8_9HELI|nr:tRNA pseudouridine(13) synthase TruD [Helicobacter sp. XJK30-2]MDL0081357.1 tRNA pseudouridine(13) synthase TruD [Helicobacter sp. XJK30-2]